MTLIEAYRVVDFQQDVDKLRRQYRDYSDASQTLSIALARRNAVQEKAYATCRDYRAAVIGTFAENDPLVASLPRLSPLPGSTPEPVVLSGQWDIDSTAARLVWTASDNAKLDHYSLRYCIGDRFDEKTESVLQSFPVDALREFETTVGLAEPGSQVSYKLYVVLETGNERGSATVTIQRPPA